MIKRLFLLTLCGLGLLAALSAHAQSAATPKVQITTNLGMIEAELYADKVPNTVANFLQYARDKHYDGTIFHRVIAGFMVQGGGFDKAYKQKATRSSSVRCTLTLQGTPWPLQSQ